MDELDKRIIALLQQDATASNAEAARQLGVSEETVRRRIKRLQGESVIWIAAVADPAKLGFGLEALVGISASPGALDKVAEALAGLDEVRLVSITTGRFDIFARIVLRSHEELHGFLRGKVEAIPDVLRTEAFVSLEMKKRSYGLST